MTMSLPQDQFKKIGDLTIRYWQEGKEGPWLLLLHGIGACAEYWQANVHELAKRFRVLAVDLPGFGKTDKPKVNYNLPYYQRFLETLIKEFNIDQFYLAAHSLGGAIALQYTIHHTDKVKKLVLIDNVGFATQVTIFFRIMGLPIVGELLSNMPEKMFKKALKTNVYNPDIITDEFAKNSYELSHFPETKRTILNIIRHHTNLFGIKQKTLQDIWNNFDKLKDIPILLFWGKQDVLLSGPVHVAAAQKHLSHIQVEWIDQCGHIAQLEYPDFVNKKMEEFLLAEPIIQ